MTRLAVISDIHGNNDALQAAAAVMNRQHIDRILCLGDVVGYGAAPQACLEWVRRNCRQVVMGNHEMMVLQETHLQGVGSEVYQVIRWTRGTCDPGTLEYLKSWPLTCHEDAGLMVHGSPWEPEQFHYIFNPWDATQAFGQAGEALILVGHTHRPAVIELSPGHAPQWHALTNPVSLSLHKRYIINVGSIGQPRNGDPRAQWIVWDQDQGAISFHAAPYAVKRAQRKIRAAGLPLWFAERLSQGY